MKLGVCVPYRNREEHLKEFVPRVGKYLESKGIEYQMYFGHQVDDKLFNRGAMKNIAAEHAFNDGCDYIVWHDIDMIPEKGCDYSYPDKHPVHIATNISQMNYQLKYEEYFGGAVLFNREQVEKTNGYSNDYWDWGMEDDDLFWRCVLEGYSNSTHLDYTPKSKSYAIFNGTSSYIEIPPNRLMKRVTHKPHTVSMLVRANQQSDKVPVYLIGDHDRRFVEYPLFRRPGWDWGLSYNNSRAFTSQLWTGRKEHLYTWMKRYEDTWSWVTLTVSENEIRMYMNGKESDSRWGTGSPSPLKFEGNLKRYGNEPYFLGTSSSISNGDPAKWFKGDVAELRVWSRALDMDEVENLHKEQPDEDLVLHYNFEDGKAVDISGNRSHGVSHNVEYSTDDIFIPNTNIPHRRNGRMTCLPHPNEGLIEVGGTMKWAKGKTTARNEERYVLYMQRGNWDYKSDGINQLKYNFIDYTRISDKAKLINITL